MKHGRSGYTSVSQGGHSDDGMNYDDNGTGKRKGNHVPTFRTSKRGRLSEHSSVNTDDNTGVEDNTDFDTSSDQSYSRRGSVDYTVGYPPPPPPSFSLSSNTYYLSCL